MWQNLLEVALFKHAFGEHTFAEALAKSKISKTTPKISKISSFKKRNGLKTCKVEYLGFSPFLFIFFINHLFLFLHIY